MQVLEKLNIAINLKSEPKKFGVLILNCTPQTNSFKGEILGRSLTDWVAFACENLPIKVVEYKNKDNILKFVKDYVLPNIDYTIILLSTTPLLQGVVIDEIKQYCIIKDIGICKLPVGYVVNNKYILDNENCIVDSVYSQHIEDFYVVESKKQFGYALEVLQDRINSFHIGNGVDIRKPKSVYIEPEVDIDEGVVIYPNNSLKGNTKISKDVILKDNNVIENSKIGNNCCISGSVISGSIISSDVYISSFCDINNSLIGSYTTIGSGSKVNNYNINNNTKLAPNTVLGEEDDSNSGTR